MAKLKLSRQNKISTFYYISILIIVAGFFILFNIRNIMPDDSPIFNTPMYKKYEVGSTNLYLSKWEYNENKGFMQVEIKYQEPDDSLGSKLTFSAKPKVNVREKLPVEVLFNSGDAYIICIKNVPKNFGAISLKVGQDNQSSLSDEDNSGSADKDISLYCDHRKVTINNNLKLKRSKDYIIDITNESIKLLKNDNEDYDKKINSNEKLIDTINKKIDQLENEYKYEVEEDQKITTEKITQLQNDISNLDKKNEDIKSTQNDNLQKIKKLQLKLSDLSK